MPKGTKKGDVLSPFDTRLKEMKQQSKKQADAAKGSGSRVWNIPEDIEADNLFDIANLHGSENTGYDRTELNTRYEECLQDQASPGTNGDIIGLKMQIDWLAAAERAFRFRHASMPRLLTLAACRRHFASEGPALTAVKDAVDKVIRAGALE